MPWHTYVIPWHLAPHFIAQMQINICSKRDQEVVRELELALLHYSHSTKPLDPACPRLEEQQPGTPWGTLWADQRGCSWKALLTGFLPSLSWQGIRWPPA